MTKPKPFCYFKTLPEIIRLAVMMYVRFSLSLRNVKDLLHERGIDMCHETFGLHMSYKKLRFGSYMWRKHLAASLQFSDCNPVESALIERSGAVEVN
jgi:hypothetical protein